ncbi:hypothetical protein C9374_003847 [Naegleria lovaniensis]|uniref:Uncharacterized protein n=1 Tax=Naegleria lovaniensis TaxID=51637 RepID=A0AA88GZV8_NAELO|nr:uncharacterized protein C9374_003847 [Naegleria lovaniensis]KAG2394083.1 hypothetical protein C9374_003847 [Naegleria lovaniensis]
MIPQRDIRTNNSSSPSSTRVAHLSKKFDSSPTQNESFTVTNSKSLSSAQHNNKRHTVSYSSNVNTAKNKIALFEKQSSIPQASTQKASSPSFQNPPPASVKNHSTMKHEVRKTIKSFEDLQSNDKSTSPSQHNTRHVKRHFKLHHHSQHADFNKRFQRILLKMESDMKQTDLFKEAFELHKRKSIMVTPTYKDMAESMSWTDTEENRLQQLLKLLREEEMKQLEQLESMIKQERQSMRLTTSPFSQSSPNLSKNSSNDNHTNLKNIHTDLILQKIKHEKKESIEQTLQQDQTKELTTTSQFQLVGKPLKERPLPETPIFMTSSPLLSSPRKASPQRSISDIETLIEEKKKRLTMNPNHVEALFEW